MPLFRRKAAAEPDAAAARLETGVRGQDLDVPVPDVRDWDERLADTGQTDDDGIEFGSMPLEHPDELVPYIDVDPSPLPGYDWMVGLYDEVRLFIDEDLLDEAEDADAFESRFAAAPLVTAVLREDREVIHLAARAMTAVQIHELAVAVTADVAAATQRQRDSG